MGTILNDDNIKILQPSTININLMNHQKTIIKKMLDFEENGLIEYKNRIHNVTIKTNIGILGDKVGAGKTLTVVSLISIKKIISNRDISCGGHKFFSISVNLNTPIINSNLIIVPHKLILQWKETINKYSNNISLYVIQSYKDIDKISTKYAETTNNYVHYTQVIDYNKINKNYDIILIGDTLIKKLMNTSRDYKWNRIFIDEIDNIILPRYLNDLMVCNFLWLITGTTNKLTHTYKPFLKDLFKNDTNSPYYSSFSSFIIKNDDKYIDQSIILPHPIRFKIKCLTPIELSIIKNIISPSILQMINAGNTEEAIRTLNCNVDTTDNIFQVITKNIIETINKKNELLKKEQLEYNQLNHEINTIINVDEVLYNNKINEKMQNIRFIQQSITKLNSKYDDIKKKIYELNNDICPVCMGEFNNPVITTCCNNCFCFDCLAVSLGELRNNKCPYCRQDISHNNMHLISSREDLIKKKSPTDNENKIKEKMDNLLEIINNKPNGSFLIFANFNETFEKIKVKLIENNISFSILKGTGAVVNTYIENYNNNKTKVLMLNAKFFGAGMNLQKTTDLIMYHRFDEEMEEQIIGRAQRLGRTTPLNVYYLLHDNESNIMVNKFNFKDNDYIFDNNFDNNANDNNTNNNNANNNTNNNNTNIIINNDTNNSNNSMVSYLSTMFRTINNSCMDNNCINNTINNNINDTIHNDTLIDDNILIDDNTLIDDNILIDDDIDLSSFKVII